MRWLIDQIKARGGQLAQRGLDGVTDLAEEGYDAIVVAAGLGSAALLGDDADSYPIRGQVCVCAQRARALAHRRRRSGPLRFSQRWAPGLEARALKGPSAVLPS